LSYCANVGQINKPLGSQRLAVIIYKVAKNEACSLISKCPIARDSYAKETQCNYNITNT